MSNIEDKIEFVDYDYEKCRQEDVPRQIKTRKSSFSSILDRFTQFRLKRLEKKLDKMRDSALTDGYTVNNFDSKIEKKATAIAKLEEKILVLSKEEVPTDYVKRRAIKLKDRMAANLSYNSGNLYSVGLEHKNDVFTSEDLSEVLDQDDKLNDEDSRIQAEIAKNVSEILDEKKSSGDDSISPDDVRAVVDEKFEELGKDKEIPVVPTLGSEEVRAVVDEKFEELGKDKEVPVESSLGSEEVRAAIDEKFEELGKDKEIPVESSLGSEEVRAAIDEKFEELGKDQVGYERVINDSPIGDKKTDSIDVSEVVSRDAVRDAINSAFNDVNLKEQPQPIPEVSEPFSVDAPVSDNSNNSSVSESIVPVDTKISKEEIEAAINEVIDRIKLSKSNGAVRFDKFNEDGTKRERSTYTPMTDEEIRESQIKLGFDENGNPVNTSDVEEEFVYTPMTDEEIRESQIKLGFDENGNPVNTSDVEEEFVYTPMTDEEIRESQIKLGFDEHGNLVNPPVSNYDKVTTAKIVDDERSPLYSEESGSSLRDSVVVAPERTARTVEKGFESLDEYGLDDSKGTYVEESSFIPKEVHIESDVSTKIEDYSILKEKILKLQKQQALSEQKKAAAQKEAEDAAAKALQARKEYEDSQKSVSRSLELLKAYSEALEEDCVRNERTAEVAENDARMNLNFVDVQKEKVVANNRLIDEIDSLIGPKADPESIKTR